jgi:hypothetical protein
MSSVPPPGAPVSSIDAVIENDPSKMVPAGPVPSSNSSAKPVAKNASLPAS